EVGAYDRSRTLVIDPVLNFSTFLGGLREDRATGVAVDAAGNSYVTGTTFSSNFPVGAAGGFSSADTTFNAAPYNELFITRYSPEGVPQYSTFLGGSNYEESAGIAVDGQGRPTITGSTQSGGAPAV